VFGIDYSSAGRAEGGHSYSRISLSAVGAGHHGPEAPPGLRSPTRLGGSASRSARGVLSKVRVWSSLMIEAFDLGIDVPRLKAERLDGGRLGLYREVGTGLTRKPEIVLGEDLLRSAAPNDICMVTLHELVHGWESSAGVRLIAASARYHSDAFRSKMRSLGLLVDVKGHTWIAAGETTFIGFLRRNGIEMPAVGSPSVQSVVAFSEVSVADPVSP